MTAQRTTSTDSTAARKFTVQFRFFGPWLHVRTSIDWTWRDVVRSPLWRAQRLPIWCRFVGHWPTSCGCPTGPTYCARQCGVVL